MATYLNMNMMEFVGQFDACTRAFVNELLPHFTPEVCLAKDFLYQSGDFGDCYYTIITGECEVLLPLASSADRAI